jgi:hypothetical protein
MKNETIYSNTAIVMNTRTEAEVEAEVADFREHESLNAYVANEKINLRWNGRVYVGNMFGMELTTDGPKLIRTVNTKGRY